MITIKLTPDGRVALRAAILLPMSSNRLWSEIADLPRFAAHDFFHAEFKLPSGQLAQGSPLIIRHSFLGVRVYRTGRVLRYSPGNGYSFSDLSSRGPKSGFPHIVNYRIEPIDARQARLNLEVRGRWTLRMLPYWLARLWLWIVFVRIVIAVENELLWSCPHPSRMMGTGSQVTSQS